MSNIGCSSERSEAIALPPNTIQAAVKGQPRQVTTKYGARRSHNFWVELYCKAFLGLWSGVG
ncbi:MAG: hypothetical protein MUD14_06350 [Hydrococcus sp. Prado102]|jgi:hypothetical protein|nr:hypothetical protein [Hydrococcus sp. Prado102]